MTCYYLAGYTGSGTEADPYRPDVPGPWAAVDVRARPDLPDGHCLVAVPEPLDPLPDGAIALGSHPSSELTPAQRKELGAALGVTIYGRRLSDVLAEVLIAHAEDIGDERWRPLRPGQRPIPGGLVRRLEIHLGGLVWEREEPFG